MSESKEQILVVNWMRKNHKNLRIFHIPNGGGRSLVTAARLKLEGVSRGVPDLFIPALKLWIEMKDLDGGVVSEEQKDWIEYLRQHGYCAEVANGHEEAIRIITARIAVFL